MGEEFVHMYVCMYSIYVQYVCMYVYIYAYTNY